MKTIRLGFQKYVGSLIPLIDLNTLEFLDDGTICAARHDHLGDACCFAAKICVPFARERYLIQFLLEAAVVVLLALDN
ncbi:hypothetical protein HBDW_23140 [Herbaspirillum sp. DW155]|uniref:hypothetical protein n=1 Tax=Herbaspirillum sp. DW155 TaxID=3095609 RepID=UPI003086FD94|nr:hypothetical protein HBDW_23140 [Herbaspirillum sp. DW155]